MIDKFRSLGALRNMLEILALIFILILPFARPTWNPMGWDVLLGAVVPALAPLIAIVLMFDVLMCWVRKTDSEDPEEIARFGFAIKAHSLIAVILFLAWMTAFSDALVI